MPKFEDVSGERKLSPYLSKRAAWALPVCTSVGRGSLVVTSNTYLSQAGPVGSVLVVSVLTTTLLYVFVTLLSVTAYPPEFSSWLEYIRSIGTLD